MTHQKAHESVPPFIINPIIGFDRNVSSNILPANQRYFEVLLILKGKGKLSIDLEQFDITDNTIFFMKPGQIHYFQTDQNLEGYKISFTESFFCLGEQEEDLMYQSAIIQSIPRSACMILEHEIAHYIEDIIEKMIQEFENDCLFRLEMLRRYLKIFLIYMARQFEHSLQTAIQNRSIEMAQKFQSLLDKHYIDKKSVAEYADLLFITPNYLNTVVKKITGNSASYHIKERVVLEAKRRATYSTLCMKEIAYALGFEDISHFSKYFKNATGVNFSEFRGESKTFGQLQFA